MIPPGATLTDCEASSVTVPPGSMRAADSDSLATERGAQSAGAIRRVQLFRRPISVGSGSEIASFHGPCWLSPAKTPRSPSGLNGLVKGEDPAEIGFGAPALRTVLWKVPPALPR